MKRISLLLSLFLLCACSNGSGQSTSGSDESQSGGGKSTSSQTSSDTGQSSSEDEPVTPIAIKDGPILHAWDWTTEMVKNALPDIIYLQHLNSKFHPRSSL